MDETDSAARNAKELGKNSADHHEPRVYETVHIDGKFILEKRSNTNNNSHPKLKVYDRRQSRQNCQPDIDIYI